MNGQVIAAEGLAKTYRVYATPWDRLREALTRRPRHRDFAALADVSFTVARGEGIGIIGENGAGKSTLLKILAGITAPSAGRVEVAGKVASILELGSAFHPELTGRQNIVLNAAMLGLTERELQEKMPAIEAFSELGPFLDQPVKAYSTGMAMRLGFSIATQVEPDVLIVDEALSVGDGYFQKKCIDRLTAFLAAGGTLLFCSHAMYYVTAFCRRALWLRQGRVAALGDANEVVRRYEDYLLAKSAPTAAEPPASGAEALPGAARITAVRIGGSETLPCLVHPDDPLELEVEWESEDLQLGFHLGVGLNRLDEVEVAAFGTLPSGLPPARGARRHSARLRVPRLPIVKGQFTLYIFLLDAEGLHIYDRRVLRAALAVESPSYTLGLVRLEHTWEMDGPSRQPVARAVARARS
ncbi:MAG TPA: ABC transporter ATP-binding protein [Thermoanaerobaculia bacterium]|nr:ABC transporter ATP-binding protein [Thermoanaerobaculia bacterium]